MRFKLDKNGKLKKPKTYPEKIIQKECVLWLRQNFDGIVFMINNDAYTKNKRKAMEYREMGVQVGMSDIGLCWHCDFYQMPRFAGIEFKSSKGVQTAWQEAIEGQLTDMGHLYEVIRSLDEMKDFVKKNRLPLAE